MFIKEESWLRDAIFPHRHLKSGTVFYESPPLCHTTCLLTLCQLLWVLFFVILYNYFFSWQHITLEVFLCYHKCGKIFLFHCVQKPSLIRVFENGPISSELHAVVQELYFQYESTSWFLGVKGKFLSSWKGSSGAKETRFLCAWPDNVQDYACWTILSKYIPLLWCFN